MYLQTEMDKVQKTSFFRFNILVCRVGGRGQTGGPPEECCSFKHDSTVSESVKQKTENKLPGDRKLSGVRVRASCEDASTETSR